MASLDGNAPLYPSGLVHYTTEIVVVDDPTVRLDALALRVERLEHEVAVLTAGRTLPPGRDYVVEAPS